MHSASLYCKMLNRALAIICWISTSVRKSHYYIKNSSETRSFTSRIEKYFTRSLPSLVDYSSRLELKFRVHRCHVTSPFSFAFRFVYATLLGKCLRESLVEHFGEESDSLEVSEGGCGCQSCEALGGTKVNIKDDVVLLLNAINNLQRSDRTEKKVCCSEFLVLRV